MYEIDPTKVGIIKANSKYCFPCDNSIIRIDKYEIGNRRVGSSMIIKDNLTFGIRESEEKFKEKAGGEEELVNMEAWQ